MNGMQKKEFMKIAFVCGSVEPGKDGVGDYVKQLASALQQSGHHVYVIALNDAYVQTYSAETPQSGSGSIPFYRIPAVFAHKTRKAHLISILSDIQADWVSFQFVPYAFDPKGLPFRLPALLRHPQLKGLKWHIMFHELWLGISKVSPLKHKVIGAFQKYIIRRLITSLKPEFISTSNILYQNTLKRSGIDADVLPLFSNIAVHEPDIKYVKEVLQSCGIDDNNRNAWKIFCIFGSIYPASRLESAFAELCRDNPEKQLLLIGMGRYSAWASGEFERLKAMFSDRIKFQHLGVLDEVHISSILQHVDVGISCTPLEHIGKSGVYAAFKLHGLEVYVSNRDTIPEFRGEVERKYTEFSANLPETWSVSSVSGQFAEKLTKELIRKKKD